MSFKVSLINENVVKNFYKEFNDVKKDENKLINYIKNKMQSGDWNKLPSFARCRVDKAVKKIMISSVNPLVIALGKKMIAKQGEFSYERLIAQIDHKRSLEHSGIVYEEDFLLLAFYTKLNPSHRFAEKFNAIDFFRINNKNLPYLLEIACNTEAEELQKKCLSFLKNELFPNPIRTINLNERNLIVQISDVDEINLVKLNYYIKKMQSIPIKIDLAPKDSENCIYFIENFSERIVSFQLQNNQTLPEQITKLTHLEQLRLIDFKNKKFPKEISEIKSLKEIYLDYAKINKLPEEIKNLNSLQVLSLQGSAIEKFPEEIKSLTNLQTLDLSHTLIETLPSWIGDFVNLRRLILNVTEITELPQEIKNMFNLEELQLMEFAGDALPKEIGELKNLIVLNLSGSHIEEIPEEIGKLNNLKILELNELDATIPHEIKNLKNLEELGLAYFNGTIPNEIYQLTNLSLLDLGGSTIEKFPEEIKNLKKLKYLYLNKCHQLICLPLGLDSLKYFEITASQFGHFNRLKFLSYCDRERFEEKFSHLFPEVSQFANKFCTLLSNIDMEDDFNIEIVSLLIKKVQSFKRKTSDLLESLDLKEIFHALQKKLSKHTFFLACTEPLESSVYDLLDAYLDQGKDIFSVELLEKFFLLEDGQKLLKKHNKKIFDQFSYLKKFVIHTFPETNKAHIDFYPIELVFNCSYDASEVTINGNKQRIKEISIKCYREQVKDPSKSLEILNKLNCVSQILSQHHRTIKFTIKFRDERGIDLGGVTQEFFTEFFSSIGLSEKFNELVSKIENSQLKLLGPIFAYLLKNPFVVGEVFHDSFFRGMIQFTYPQICSKFDDLKEEEVVTLLNSGYSTQEENERIKSLLAILSWDDSKEVNRTMLADFIKFYRESGRDLEMGLSDELIKLIDQVDLIEEPLVGTKRQRQENWPSAKFSKKSHDATLSDQSRDSLEEIQMYLNNPIELENLKTATLALLIDYKNQLRNIHSILQAMGISEDDWNHLKSQGAEFLKTSIQGYFTKQAFLNKIRYDHMEKNIVEYFQNWFMSAEESELKDFLRVVTGSPTIPLKEIQIRIGNRIQALSCFNMLDLPPIANKEELQFYMDLLLKGDLSFNE